MSQAPGSHYDRFYRDHHGWLHGWLHRRLDCSETAADLAHDTFFTLLKRGDQPDELRKPRAFLATVARGLVVNHWRRQDIEQAYLTALAGRPERVEVSEEERVQVLEAIYEVDALLRRLPEKARRAFLMAQFDGMTYAAIGNVLGVSERMVKKYMAKAMLHCLTYLENR